MVYHDASPRGESRTIFGHMGGRATGRTEPRTRTPPLARAHATVLARESKFVDHPASIARFPSPLWLTRQYYNVLVMDTTAPPRLQCPSAPLSPISEHLHIHRRRSHRSARPSESHNPLTAQRHGQGGAPVSLRHPHLPCSQWMCVSAVAVVETMHLPPR